MSDLSEGDKVRIYLPILEWKDEDVANFIKDRNIKCAPVYYDETGQFHVERRLGCIGCPLASARIRIATYKQYPGMLKAQINALGKFYETHPDTVGAQMWGKSPYKKFCSDLFFSRNPKSLIEEGLFEVPDAKEFLENYFEIKL